MQRAIWIITFFIILGGAYYWFVIHEADVLEVKTLTARVELHSDSINVVNEAERKLELRYIGHGKHLQTIQDRFNKHYDNYVAKMDSINGVFEEVKYNIEQTNEKIDQEIRGVKNDISDFTDTFDSYKRTNQRQMRDLQNDVRTLKDDISAIQETLTSLANPEKK